MQGLKIGEYHLGDIPEYHPVLEGNVLSNHAFRQIMHKLKYLMVDKSWYPFRSTWLKSVNMHTLYTE